MPIWGPVSKPFDSEHLSRPFERALAFLDPLLRRAALVVEGDDPLGRPRQIGRDEADTGYSSPGCHSALATTRRGLL
jgi:hypothetical protein